MPHAPAAPPVPFDVVRDFLSGILPFSELPAATVARLARRCVIDFAPAGTRLLIRGVTRPEDLLIVQKGGVKLYLTGEDGSETLLDHRGEGGFVGELALIQNEAANVHADTLEDTFLVRLAGEAFQEALRTEPLMAQYFLKTFSRVYLSRALSEMVDRRVSVTCASGLSLFSSRVGELVGRPPVTAGADETIQAAAWRMAKCNVGSVLVRDAAGRLSGIATDKDLRRAVALGMNTGAPVAAIASSPLRSIEAGAICFDALLKMMTAHIHHLVVTREGEPVGVVTSHDILVLQGTSPMAVFREILTQERPEGLHTLAAKIPQVVRTLVQEGARAGNVTRMIAVLNDLILERVIALVLREIGPPPLPFCWLLMGSEGRREQTFATDQDNALVVKDTADDILKRAADIYFAEFSRRTVEQLVRCGFPACKGGIMASNPEWRMPFAAWRDRFEGWILRPEPREVMHATIFFDFRPGPGDPAFAEALRRHIAHHAPRQEIFLRQLAADACTARPPLSFFKSFVVEKTGEHKNRLDLKGRGLLPITDFARVLALQHGIMETNTLTRLTLLGEGGHAPRELAADAAEAFEFLLQLRLVHQLALVEAGRPPDNHIDPARLSELEKRTLKEAFGVIGRLQGHLREVFRLNL